MAEARRDKRGRTYWVEPGKGRVAAPKPSERPRAYRVDKAGRGYWTFLDTGKRAPKPAWDEAPRWDSLGRPLDSTGRRVPRAALESEPVAFAVAPEPRPRAKRPKVPLPPRAELLGPGDAVTGFKQDYRRTYSTKPGSHQPRDLAKIFSGWAQGAVAKSPVASDVYEIAMRQAGVVFSLRGGIDRTALAELNNKLEGQPVAMVYRQMARYETEVWIHGNRPNRRTGAVEQKDYDQTKAQFRAIEAAANIVYDWALDYETDFYWYEYIETDEDLYEG